MNDDDELKGDFSEKNMDHVKVSKLKVELLNNLFLSEVNQRHFSLSGGWVPAFLVIVVIYFYHNCQWQTPNRATPNQGRSLVVMRSNPPSSPPTQISSYLLQE